MATKKRRSRKRKSNDIDTDTDNVSIEHEQPTKKRKISKSDSKSNYIQFDIQSSGYCDQASKSCYKSWIKVTNNETRTKGIKTFDLQNRRGHRIVVINGITGDIEQSIAFDTWADIYSGIRLDIFLKTLQFKANKWVLIITHDSGYNINAEAAWNEFEKWGASKQHFPRHREAHILILSTNRNEKWWQNIVDAEGYFLKKYDKTIASWNKKLSKKLKKQQKIGKIENERSVYCEFMSENQWESVSKFAQNIFFEKKCLKGEGPLILKGFLPKMKAMEIESNRQYLSALPIELAIKNGIKPCDGSEDGFYCNSCLNGSDREHLLVCNDCSHFDDCDEKNKECEIIQNGQEFPVRACGQCFHIYCCIHPQDIWIRWCQFMRFVIFYCVCTKLHTKCCLFLIFLLFFRIPFDTNSYIPKRVQSNIKQQHKLWEKFLWIAENKHNDESTQEEEESDDSLECLTKGNIEYYASLYAQYGNSYKLVSKIRDLSKWKCHFHNDAHRIMCKCGKPMVEQLCVDAHGETDDDKKKFEGLYCSNFNRGCEKIIKPNDTVFRCINGARCKASPDGTEYCIKCIIQKLIKMDPKLSCLCGNDLILGDVQNVKEIFDEKKENDQQIIKKANTLRCAWCMKKFVSKHESLYYCTEQTDKCQRVVKNHFVQLQPFVVCIGCVVQCEWMTQTCACGYNLHCRLLADWIHHDIVAYDSNISNSPSPKPNNFKIRKNKKKKRKNHKHTNSDREASILSDCASPNEFYLNRRANDDEIEYFDQMSRKYVDCSLCNVQITAYQFVFICNRHQNETKYFCAKCAIKQRQKQSLFPSCSQNVQMCLLFVAHDGIAQSELWQQWLNEDESIKHKIGIAVQCNNWKSLKNGKEFAEKYRIDVQRPTNWGKLNVPLTIQKSLQISLSLYPECKRFYIISGSEIPLVSAKHLFSMPIKTQIMAKKVTKMTASKLKKKRMGKLMQWYSHHAAMCLSRNHAQMLSTAPWKEYFSDSNQVYDGVGAPDEFLFATTLNAMQVDMRNEIWREVTTDFEIPTSVNTERHPICWKDLNEEVTFYKVSQDMKVKGVEKKSLYTLLSEHYSDDRKLWGYGPCFFRKVSANVDFGDFVPWKLCKLKPPMIDEENGLDETKKYRESLGCVAYMDLDEIYGKN